MSHLPSFPHGAAIARLDSSIQVALAGLSFRGLHELGLQTHVQLRSNCTGVRIEDSRRDLLEFWRQIHNTSFCDSEVRHRIQTEYIKETKQQHRNEE